MEIKLRRYKYVFILDIVGELDLYSSPSLVKFIEKLRKNRIRLFVLNLSNTTYLDSSGIGAFIKLHTQSKENNEIFILSSFSKNIQEIITHAGLINFFNCEKDLKSAVKMCINMRGESNDR